MPISGQPQEIKDRLAQELRIGAMAELGDLFADILMGPMREVIAFYIKGEMPAAVAELPMGTVSQLHDASKDKSIPDNHAAESMRVAFKP